MKGGVYRMLTFMNEDGQGFTVGIDEQIPQ